MRTLTLLFFAVASLLLGALAMAPAVVAIGVYQAEGDRALAFGVYGYFVAVVAVAAPVLFMAAAIVSALRVDGGDRGPRTVEQAEALIAQLEARDPNDRYRR